MKAFFDKLDVELKIQHWHMMALCVVVGFALFKIAFWIGGVIYHLLKELVKWMLLN